MRSNRVSGNEALSRNREMQRQTILALKNTIDKIKAQNEFRVHKLESEWIMGPLKWLVIILGPNHQAKDINQLLYDDYVNINIIVVLVTTGKIIYSPAKGQQPQGENRFFDENSKQLPSNIDLYTKQLNQLCRLTPEGFMVLIEQKQFEGKDVIDNNAPVAPDKSMVAGKALLNQTEVVKEKNYVSTMTKNVLTKDIERIFLKICQGIELYETKNIPIVTEFLEF